MFSVGYQQLGNVHPFQKEKHQGLSKSLYIVLYFELFAHVVKHFDVNIQGSSTSTNFQPRTEDWLPTKPILLRNLSFLHWAAFDDGVCGWITDECNLVSGFPSALLPCELWTLDDDLWRVRPLQLLLARRSGLFLRGRCEVCEVWRFFATANEVENIADRSWGVLISKF